MNNYNKILIRYFSRCLILNKIETTLLNLLILIVSNGYHQIVKYIISSFVAALLNKIIFII